MIDKINGNDGYDFHSNNSTNKRKNPAVKAYENTPGAGPSGQKKADRNNKKGSAPAGQKESGVILDLSGKAAGRKKASDAGGRRKDSSWADALRRLAGPVIRWLKNFWESDFSSESSMEASDAEKTEAVTFDAETEAPAADTEELPDESLPPLDELSEAEERKMIADAAAKSASLQQIEQLVTRNGAKRLAHNSDLLTYYDRRGKFVEMDETEKYRVLFGDKNVLKL